jgi:hypothetical protein
MVHTVATASNKAAGAEGERDAVESAVTVHWTLAFALSPRSGVAHDAFGPCRHRADVARAPGPTDRSDGLSPLPDACRRVFALRRNSGRARVSNATGWRAVGAGAWRSRQATPELQDSLDDALEPSSIVPTSQQEERQ